ncbi:MAG: hypothetical protein KGL13_00800 [Gammaproteobacteria bacterium]|nr:hypothetical protein [Gammaproteobacteria bacterium]
MTDSWCFPCKSNRISVHILSKEDCMKVPLFVFVVLGLLGGLQVSARAGNWDKYLAIYNRFYLLNNQKITKINCSVDAPSFDQWIKLVRTEVAKLAPNLTVVDTLGSYSLTFENPKGLSISDPTMMITALGKNGQTDDSGIEQEITQTDKAEFTASVKGIDTVLQSLFTLLQTPKPGNIDIYYISNNNNIQTVSYGMSGAQVTATFNPDSTAMKVTNQYSDQDVRFSYEKTPAGKLLLNASQVTTKGIFTSKNISTSVNYQKLGNVEFPENIAVQVMITGIDMQQTSKLSINIEGCKFK